MCSKWLETNKEKDLWSFFDYEQGNLNPKSTPAAPFNNFGNFVFPKVIGYPNYGYTGRKNAQQQNNQQSSSGFQNYAFNNQTPQDPYYFNFSPCDSNNSEWDE